MLSKNKKLLLLLIVTVQILFFFCWYFIELSKLSNPTAKTILVKTMPIDPRDMLSGNYMRLRYEFSNVLSFRDGLQVYKKCQESRGPIYAVLKQNQQFYSPDYLTLQKPLVNKDQVVIAGECRSDAYLQIIYGIEKYFIAENAPQVIAPTGSEVSLVIGDDLKPMIKSLKINGVELKQGDVSVLQNQQQNNVVVDTQQQPSKVESRELVKEDLPVKRGLVSWFDASDTNLTNVRYITFWHNIAVNDRENNATQNFVRNAPLRDEKFMNGLPAVVFDSKRQTFLTTENNVAGDMVIFVVLKTSDVGLGDQYSQAYEASSVLWSDVSGAALDIIPLAIGEGRAKFFTGSSESTLTNQKRIDDGKAHIIRVVRNTRIGKRKLCVDGDAMVFDIKGGSEILNANPKLVIGGNTIDGRYFDGGISEILIYRNTLNRNEVTNIEQYLGKKWGISIEESIQ